MAQNYTRQSTFSDGDTITASLFNDEYNQLVNAFAYSSTSASSTGHRHDGSAGQGGNIFKIGDLDFLNKIEVDSTNNRWGFYVEVSSAAVEQIRIQDGAVVPVTTNDIDLGTTSLQFKDLYIDGTANVDSLTLTSGVTVTTILDQDDMSSNSATALATQQSIKAYVDSQVATVDTLSEVLTNGNTTGGTDIVFGDNDKALFGAGSDLQIYHDGSNSYITDQGTGSLFLEGTNQIKLSGSAGDYFLGQNNGSAYLYYAGALKFYTTSTGIDVTGVITTDGMTTSADINFGDNDKAVFGAGSDLQIYHDGTNSFVRDFGDGDLNLWGTNVTIGSASGNLNLTTVAGGATTLLHNNSAKLATTSTGINVTGTAVTDGVTVAGNLSVDGGTIKLDGNYPTGSNNVALGDNAFNSVTSGGNNVLIGHNAGTSITTGNYNTAVGSLALDSAQTSDYNVAFGASALRATTTGERNIAIGTFALDANTSADNNTAVGYQALSANTIGSNSTAIGYHSLYSNTTGIHNVAIGASALDANTTASNNIAVGNSSLGAATTGSENVAIGKSAASTMTTASGNVALGFAALQYSTSSSNVAIGKQAMQNSTSGTQNVAIGAFALDAVNIGSYQTAVGYGTLSANTSGNSNTALGYFALNKNTTASRNTAVGYNSLTSNLTGSDNTAVGYDALSSATGGNNTAVGKDSLKSLTAGSHSVAVGNIALSNVTTGTSNTALGSQAGQQLTTGSFNVAVGRDAFFSATTDSNNIAMGYRALQSLTGSGGGNLAFGYESQRDSVTGNSNVSMGNSALQQNTTGDRNVAIGAQALQQLNVINDGDSYNIAVGFQAGRGLTTGTFNTVVGSLALDGITTQTKNTVLGYSAASNKTSGDAGIYIGIQAGRTDNGSNNIAIGEETLRSNSNGGSHNIAIGHDALYNFNSTNAASMNIAIGRHAGRLITTAVSNTIIGGLAGGSITTGTGNTVLGRNAGTAITTATYNTVLGDNSGSLITTGQKNTILGRFSGNQGGLDIRTSNNHIVLSDGDGNPRAVVDSSGNVGIGTTSPSANLHVSSSGDTIARITSADGNGAFLDLGDASDPDGGRIVYDSGSNLGFSTQSTERMRINSAGRVGIGTSSPQAKLDVSDSNPKIRFSDTTNPNYSTITNLDGNMIYSADAGNQSGNSRHRFEIDGTEVMRINLGGNVGIGTTSPDSQLELSKSSSSNYTALKISNTSTSGAAGRLTFENTLGAGTFESGHIRGASTSFGNGGLIFEYNTSGTATGATEAMRIDSSGNVGIGTSSPSRLLHLEQNVNGNTGGLIKNANSGSNAYANLIMRNDSSKVIEVGVQSSTRTTTYPANEGWIYVSDGLNLGYNGNTKLFAGGSEAMRIDTSGNLLVGKTAINASTTGVQIEANGTITATRSGRPFILNRTTSDGDLIELRKNNSTVGSIGVNAGNDLAIDGTHSSADTGLKFVNGTLRPRQNSTDSDGDVSLGAGSFRFQHLFLSGDTYLSNGSNLKFKDSSGTSRDILSFDSNNDVVYAPAGAGVDNHIWKRNGSEYMRLDTSGRLIVGTTTLPTSGTAGVSLQSGGNVHCGLASTSAADVMRFDNPNGRVGSITVGGSTTTYNTSSDERLKENIADADDAGAVVDAIQVRKFDWISDGEHQRYGMVAQELNTVAPEAVTEGETADDMMGVDYSKLVPMLVKEIQSLRARVAQLEGEN